MPIFSALITPCVKEHKPFFHTVEACNRQEAVELLDQFASWCKGSMDKETLKEENE